MRRPRHTSPAYHAVYAGLGYIVDEPGDEGGKPYYARGGSVPNSTKAKFYSLYARKKPLAANLWGNQMNLLIRSLGSKAWESPGRSVGHLV